ncbi:hypothetical protein AAVH_21807 [Aphelenchoides avenae]|nr:hypothetical protein AAVH_21807 [Aphelenchus avenae]
MAEQRSAERTTLMNDVKTCFGVPLQEITDDQLHELSDQDCKKTLPLLVKLSQNLYMDITLNYKKAALMSVDVRFAHGLRDGYRMWLSVMQTPPGYQGIQNDERNVGLLLEKIPIMRAAIEHPLEDLPNVEEEVFGGPFQLADEAHINSIPLHECKPTLQLFAKFTQNLQEELAVCGKHERVRELDLQFMTTEKTLYENAFRELLDKLEPQG